MKIIVSFLLLLICLSYNGTAVSQSSKHVHNLIGVFDGRTPCKELAGQLRETFTTDCTKIKWRLILYKDSTNPNSGNYELLGFIYRKTNPRTGKWTLIKGAGANPNAVVYQLDQQKAATLFLMKCGNNVLYFLDNQKNLLVGNRDFSYTLNRVNKQL